MSFLLAPARRTGTIFTSSSSIASRAFSTTRSSQLARMTLVGRIGTDPEVVETPGGKSVIRYVVACKYGNKDNRQTSWFRVSSFAAEGSGTRDFVLGLGKGTLIYLEADAQMKQFEDSSGSKQSALNLIQTKVDVLKRPTPTDGAPSS